MELPSSLRPLRHRDFGLLFFANTVSNVGTWMQTIAVGALVEGITHQPVWAAIVAVAAFLPVGLISPVGGVLADRLDRRMMLMVTNAIEAGNATVLAILVATGHGTPVRVTLLVLLEGCVSSLRLPFQQAIIPDLVPDEELLAAASLGSTQYNLGRVVGPALAGIVIVAGGYSWAFVVNAISFFAVIIALVFIRLPRPPGHDGAGVWEGIVTGARMAWREPGCRAAIQLIGTAAFLVAPFIALIPAKALALVGHDKHDIASATAVLTTAQGIGAITGALLVAPLAERYGRQQTLLGYLVLTPIAVLAYAGTTTTVWAAVTIALVGGLYIGLLSGLNTVVQIRAPAEFRGRILSLFFVALGVTYPIGALVQGAIANHAGLGPTTAVAAAVMVLVVIALRATRAEMFEYLGELRAPIEPVAPPAESVP
ncbi:MAG: MFS transporter [Actinobacteria bacterium]|nr:MFS transporter [Actinomycetota bacterium]MBV8960900.1 MFS transporter [Actinomycetota bacterium]MBV9255837.1 MFS transporter [Actinomycetota bacterium]MBV9662579.1 MFS transporter [Actinomycetota bacterium]MBV9934777.1 MFS transporter [Actinomycetota bacterium]